MMLVFIPGVILIGWVLWDAFETILLPRRVPARLRVSHFVLPWFWALWSGVARNVSHRPRRENLLGVYALLAILALFIVWASGLIVGFALLFWAGGSRLRGDPGMNGFGADLYMSGTTFFTLGLGDLHPHSVLARLTTVVEAGTGFGFLALVIAYVPVLYQAFSKRESRITMLDEWAGSPPTAAVLLRRWSESKDPKVLEPLLKDWELAAAQILESHLSYPILCFFRSQHDNQSWLASLTAILDTCALVIVGVDGIDPFQARLTFAIARHALVDLSQTLRSSPIAQQQAVLDLKELGDVRAWLEQAGVKLAASPEDDRKLEELRGLYIPYARQLSSLLMMPLAPALPSAKTRYNWETSAWAKTARDEAH
jgi:hypothetical protein